MINALNINSSVGIYFEDWKEIFEGETIDFEVSLYEDADLDKVQQCVRVNLGTLVYDSGFRNALSGVPCRVCMSVHFSPTPEDKKTYHIFLVARARTTAPPSIPHHARQKYHTELQ